MKTIRTRAILLALGFVAGAVPVNAQESGDDYAVTQSIEVGVRIRETDGNSNKYRSDLNYGQGVRLFNFNLFARSKNNTGRYFDTARVSASGWGGDPAAYLRIEAEKTKLYRFNMNYRHVDYFNNLTNLALNQHLADKQRKFGDFNLTLFPQNERIKVHLSYALNRDKGNTFSTYSYLFDEFPVSVPVKNSTDDFSVGVDVNVSNVNLSILQGYRRFNENTTYSISGLEPGNNTTNNIFLDSVQRTFPTRGRMPFTRASVHTLIKKKLDITGRLMYTRAKTTFTMRELTTGEDFIGNTITLDQYESTGKATRPNTVGDIGISLFPTNKLTISETFRVNDFKIEGDRSLTQTTSLNAAPATARSTQSSRLAGYRQYLNGFEVDYRFTPAFLAHVGYRVAQRRITLNPVDTPPPGTPAITMFEKQTNRTNTVFGGFKAKPVPMWTLYFDMEHGTGDNVFVSVGNYDVTNLRMRTLIKPTPQLSFNISLVTKDNKNPSIITAASQQVFNVDIDSRILGSSVDWRPNAKVSVSSGYTYTWMDTRTDIVFFLSGTSQNGTSQYFLRNHYAFLNGQVQPHPRVTLSGGCWINRDTGQGDRIPATATELITSYPLNYQSIRAGLSVKLSRNIDWNAGWQYYDYDERLENLQDYRAHTAYTSFTFNYTRN